MQIGVLVFGILILIGLSYSINHDILMPSFILNICYFFSAILMVLSLDISDYRWNTVGIVLLGLFVFQMIEIVLHHNKKIGKDGFIESNYIDISRSILYIVIIIQVIATIAYAADIIRVTNGQALVEAFKIVRRQNMYATELREEENITFYVSRVMKVNYAAAYVNMYVLINNVHNKKMDAVVPLSISIALYLVQATLSGGRMQYIRLMLGGIFVLMILYKRENGWNEKFSLKVLIKVLIYMVLLVVLFHALRVFVGRTSQKNQTLIETIIIYYSAGLYLFNQYLKAPIRNTGDMVGTQTFKDFFNLLYRWGIRTTRIVPMLEFRSIGKGLIDNLYTALRYYYQDFGIKGIVIMQAILSGVFNWIYSRIKYSNRYNLIPVYSFIFFALVMHVNLDQFFSILSVGYIETIVWMIILYEIETKVRIKWVKNVK